MEAPPPVTLIIKAPNQKYTDQTILCFLDWTVGRLKTHLSKVYPSQPSTKDQRLVYSGRLLPDHLQLKDILRKQDEYHMVHLVCSSRTPPNSPKPDNGRENNGSSTSSNLSNSENLGSTASPVQETSPTTASGSSDSLRHRNLPQAQSNPTQSHPFPYIMQGISAKQIFSDVSYNKQNKQSSLQNQKFFSAKSSLKNAPNESWPPAQTGNKIAATSSTAEQSALQSLKNSTSIVKDSEILESLTRRLTESPNKLKISMDVQPRGYDKETLGSTVMESTSEAHSKYIPNDQQEHMELEAASASNPLNNKEVPANEEGISSSSENDLLMHLEGEEIIEGAISAFKVLPISERQTILSALDKMRSELLEKITEAEIMLDSLPKECNRQLEETQLTCPTTADPVQSPNHTAILNGRPSGNDGPANGNVGNQFPGQGGPAGFPVYPAFSPLQMIWWQQMYARQYYMQYQAAVSAQATPSTEPANPPVPQPTNSEDAPANEPPAAPNVAPQENRPMNQNVQMNAQGGPVMNEEDFNRDWLDWMYTFSRAAILLSIVYFYSSFSRFVMVMGAMLLVYLHQAGWFPFRQEGIHQPAANNNADMNHDGQNVNNAGLEEMERLMDDGLDENSGEEVVDINAEQHPGFMASAWSFITTFFTSLIPEGPPQVGN